MMAFNLHIALPLLSLFSSHNRLEFVIEDNDQMLYVPVIVHVVYQNELQNISYAQILSQLNVINEDFNGRNSNIGETIGVFEDLAADCRVQFYLYDQNHDQFSEEGIVRQKTNHGDFVNNDLQYEDLGGSSAILSGEVLNIWVADLGGDALGYSQSLTSHPIEEVGVVLDYEYFGTEGTAKYPFDGGRTLTHEIGHWFGLAHLWGLNGCGDGDNIEDTPEMDSPITKCELDHVSCGSLDMTQNFMNLAEDQCMTFFSAGQKEFMRNYILTELPNYIHDQPVLRSELAGQLKVYPNPSNGEIHISVRENDKVQVEVFDIVGRNIPTRLSRTNEVWNLIADFTADGQYILQIDISGRIYTKRVIYKK
ncbi:zinc-dependent metalloprotease [Marinoscillum pacificum]|uniref:zinc-dependent metalloprotease n=1 Tax=Marinoscillum pacificum TaxID=392723 RepID=UPI0021583B69|nr:zinc-dependent metalloprotease [Marinoscillum pacificum]